MRAIKIRVNSELLFLLGYGCWLFTAIIHISSMYANKIPWIPYTPIRYLFLLLMFAAFLMGKHHINIRECGMIVAASLVLVSLLHFWGSIYAESLAICALGYHFDFKRIGKVTLWIVLFALVFVMCSSMAGIIRNYNYKSQTDTRDRWGIGFKYATYPSHYLLLITLLVFYLYRENIGLRQVVPIVILNLYVYRQSHSRNSMMLCFGVLFCAFLFKYTKFSFRNSRLQKFLFACEFIYLTVIQFILAVVYDPTKKWMLKLNDLMSERLRLNTHAFRTYNITLFGQVTQFEAKAWKNGFFRNVGTEYTGMDSSYLGILYRNGVVSLGFYLLIFTVAGFYALKHKDRYLTVILFVIAAHSTFDPQLNLLQYNTFMLLAFSITAGVYRENLSEIFRRVFRIGKKQKQSCKQLYL